VFRVYILSAMLVYSSPESVVFFMIPKSFVDLLSHFAPSLSTILICPTPDFRRDQIPIVHNSPFLNYILIQLESVVRSFELKRAL